MRALGGLLVAVTLVLAAGCGDDTPERVDGQGYSYEVPDGWDDVSEQAAEEIDFGGLGPDTAVVGDRDDGFAVNVNVVREGGLPPGVTAAQYVEASIAGVRDPRAAGFPPELIETLERMRPRQISQPSDAELDGRKALRWEYVSTQEGHDLHHMLVAAVMDGAGYTLTLSALPEQVEDGEEALDEVVDSWEWE